MPEELLAQTPHLMRWKGAKVGRTIFGSTAGTLTLTSERLVFEGDRGGALSIPLDTIEGCTLTGKLITYLTVAYRGQRGTEHSTFGTQQFGMPSGSQWVDNILQARDRATSFCAGPTFPGPSGAAPPPSGAAAHRPQPAADALDRFAAQGSAPSLLIWRVARTLPHEVVPPHLGRVEVWDDAVSAGPIQYVQLVVGYRPDGSVRVIAAAEVMPAAHAECYLGVFVDGVHHNLGADPAHADPAVFASRGVEVVLGVLDGQARADERAAAPLPSRAPEPAPTTGDFPAVSPTTGDIPVVPQPMTPEDATARLRELSAMAFRVAAPLATGEREALLLDLANACEALRASDDLLEQLRTSSRTADDPRALDAAAAMLSDAGLSRPAAALLRAALALGHQDTETVDRLAVALHRSGEEAAATHVYQEHPWAVERSVYSRALASHHAALRGELTAVRELLEDLPTDAPVRDYRGFAVARLARADALGGPEDAAATAGSELRWWEVVLQGSVLLHSSRAGEEDMKGRYAAVWDREDLFQSVLGLLDAVLVDAGLSPTAILAAPDRDSQVLGHVLAARYGLDGVRSLEEGPTVEGVPLVVAYRWHDLGDWLSRIDAAMPHAVFFAYSLDWTRTHPVAPDVIGMLAQVLYPPWGQRQFVRDVAGAPGGREVETVPADTRPAELLGGELAAEGGGGPDPEDLGAVLAVVRALRRATLPPGLLGGPRDPWFTGGPVHSNRF